MFAQELCINMEITPGTIDKNIIVETDKWDVSNCTSPRGHCYLEESRVQKLSLDKTKLEEDAFYLKCRYCSKYSYVESKEEYDSRKNNGDNI